MVGAPGGVEVFARAASCARVPRPACPSRRLDRAPVAAAMPSSAVSSVRHSAVVEPRRGSSVIEPGDASAAMTTAASHSAPPSDRPTRRAPLPTRATVERVRGAATSCRTGGHETVSRATWSKHLRRQRVAIVESTGRRDGRNNAADTVSIAAVLPRCGRSLADRLGLRRTRAVAGIRSVLPLSARIPAPQGRVTTRTQRLADRVPRAARTRRRRRRTRRHRPQLRHTVAAHGGGRASSPAKSTPRARQRDDFFRGASTRSSQQSGPASRRNARPARRANARSSSAARATRPPSPSSLSARRLPSGRPSIDKGQTERRAEDRHAPASQDTRAPSAAIASRNSAICSVSTGRDLEGRSDRACCPSAGPRQPGRAHALSRARQTRRFGRTAAQRAFWQIACGKPAASPRCS